MASKKITINQSGEAMTMPPVKCPSCGKLFKDRKYLNRHVRATHDKSTNYSCTTCGKIFDRVSNLKRHKKTHDKCTIPAVSDALNGRDRLPPLQKRVDNSLAEASNNFGLKLHLKLAEEQTNLFFSPFSVSMALAMLFRGAKGETADEIRKVLCFDEAKLPDEQIHRSYNQLLDVLTQNQEFYTLASANAIAVQKNFPLLSDYKSDLQSIYKALVLEVDFATESSAAVSQINEWVKKNTKDKIPSVFKSLDEDTVVVLLNAIYFKGTWMQQFNPKRTNDGPFYNKGNPDQPKLVPLMRITKKFPFAEKETYKVLELPYEGDNMAMLLFLPNEMGGLADFESSLNGKVIQTVRDELAEMKVDVTIPKLHLEYSKELSDILKALGMTKVFECGANLKGLSDCGELIVSKVVHKTVLDVNEEGSEAAAVTAIQANCRCLVINPEFNADHPFLFVIYDQRNNLILFMGRVEEL